MTRLVLILACVLLLALVAVRAGWRGRGRRQAGRPALPVAPDEFGGQRLPSIGGRYVGATFASSWQDRVVHAGLGARAAASMSLYDAGVLVDRDGTDAVFVPVRDIVGARPAPGLAGKVVGAGGLLVVSWRLGEAELDTGFRADDKSTYPDWVRAINAEVAR